ncbi:MAG: restriction endonuclease [archaeon]|nr:restriction endonuclease [archaeon]
MVMIIKANGIRVAFDRKKARNSCKYAGASTSLAKEIISVVEAQLHDGMTTSDMKDIIYNELEKREGHTAAKYDIRKAIAELDPATHQFEKYIAHLYQYYGYETEWSPIPKPNGLCIDHEIDVLLKKDENLSFIECKHHFRHHRYTGLKVPMRVWARLQDLRAGFEAKKKSSYDIKEAIVVTNTKYSEHAIKYAKCKKKSISLVGWKTPSNDGCLNNLIENKKAYPLTLLKLDANTVFRLCELGVHDIHDFAYVSSDILARSGLSRKDINTFKNLVEKIIA